MGLSINELTIVAKQGDADAQFNLGVCYYEGEGVERDLRQAAYWYAKAADQGDAFAQCFLGRCYERGEGVERNIELAKKLYILAAQNGIDEAKDSCIRLGLKY